MEQQIQISRRCLIESCFAGDRCLQYRINLGRSVVNCGFVFRVICQAAFVYDDPTAPLSTASASASPVADASSRVNRSASGCLILGAILPLHISRQIHEGKSPRCGCFEGLTVLRNGPVDF